VLANEGLLNLHHPGWINGLLASQFGRGFLVGVVFCGFAGRGRMSGSSEERGCSQSHEQRNCQACSKRKHADSPLGHQI
jgi:hypothetical protein